MPENITPKFPENCTKCTEYKTCQRYYGAIGCKYHKEIVKAILEQHEKEERERQHEEV